MLWIAATQLSEYLQGTRQSFDLPFNFKGTDFQKVTINLLAYTRLIFFKACWNELLKIPYGSTISYSQLAHRVGRPKAARHYFPRYLQDTLLTSYIPKGPSARQMDR